MSSLLRTLAVISILGLFGLAIVSLETPMRGEVAQPNANPKAQARFKPELLSVLDCKNCHSGDDSPSYKDHQDKMPPTTDFIRLDEYRLWDKQDLHRRAYANINPSNEGESENLAWRMQSILQQDPERGASYRVVERAECLACHAVDLRPREVDKTKLKEDRFSCDNGVSCVSCHGLADTNWLGEHLQKSWRDKSPTEKLEKYGQIDLRSPRIRAEKCASCHIGNKAEGKFVTHDMYAAGHPPLPVFEMASYLREEPAHYYSMSKNIFLIDLRKKNEAAARENFHFRKDKITEARDVAVGVVIAFQANLRLLQSEVAAMNPNELLDYAHFDCAACHHDLKYPSDRQNRNDGRALGRPLLKMPTELFEAVLDHASGSDLKEPKLDTETRDNIAKDLKRLRAAVDARPFGDINQIKEIAGDLDKLCDRALASIDGVIYTQEVAKELARAIAKRLRDRTERPMGAKLSRYLDHDSAQQLVWAALVLHSALHPESAEKDAESAQHKALAGTIQLSLRDMKPKSNCDAVAHRLDGRFTKQNSYNADAFFKAMKGWLNEFGESEKKR